MLSRTQCADAGRSVEQQVLREVTSELNYLIIPVALDPMKGALVEIYHDFSGIGSHELGSGGNLRYEKKDKIKIISL